MGSPNKPLTELKKATREAWKACYPRDPRIRTEASLKVCQTLLQQSIFSQARRIALFAGLPHEINLLFLFQFWPRAYAFPQVNRLDQQLSFFEMGSPRELSPGSLDILEPSPGGPPLQGWTEGDLFLVPGFGFDRQGNRIGTGAGYYDRFFAKNPAPKRWGICFHQQFHDQELAHTHHDVRMEAVVTDKGFFQTKKGE